MAARRVAHRPSIGDLLDLSRATPLSPLVEVNAGQQPSPGAAAFAFPFIPSPCRAIDALRAAGAAALFALSPRRASGKAPTPTPAPPEEQRRTPTAKARADAVVLPRRRQQREARHHHSCAR